jgi:LEA14-like dessication related protein
MQRRTFMMVATLAALSGCATLSRPIAPEIVATSVRAVDLQRLPEVGLAIELTVYNRNLLPLAIDGIDAAIVVAGKDIGHAKLAQPVTLPRQGETQVPLDVKLDAAMIVVAGIDVMLDGGRAGEYELRGTMRLADGTSWPFARRGVLRQRRP